VKRSVLVAAVAVASVLVATSSCGGDGGGAATASDTLTRRQRDSVISTMPIPGAGGVGRALDAQDRARERAAQLDSIL
jgi:hypothetical protein